MYPDVLVEVDNTQELVAVRRGASHLVFPSPAYPGKQVQLYEPGTFTHWL